MKPTGTKKTEKAVVKAATSATPTPKKQQSWPPPPTPDPRASTAIAFDPIVLPSFLALDGSDGIRVKFRHRVTGRVAVPIPANLFLQPLVLSADGKWYLQKAAEINPDGTWSVECVFGYHYSVHEFSVAIVANGGLTKPFYDQIPASPLTSPTITVVRTEPEPAPPGTAEAKPSVPSVLGLTTAV